MKDPKTMTNEELVNQFRINVMIMEIKCLKTELMSRLQSTVSHELPGELNKIIDEAPMLGWFNECKEGVGGDYGFFSAGCDMMAEYLKSKSLAVKPENNGLSFKRLPERGVFICYRKLSRTIPPAF